MIRKPSNHTPKRVHQSTKCDVRGGLPCWTHCDYATFVLDVLGHLDRYYWNRWARKRTLERFLELGARLAELRETLERLRDAAEQEMVVTCFRSKCLVWGAGPTMDSISTMD